MVYSGAGDPDSTCDCVSVICDSSVDSVQGIVFIYALCVLGVNKWRIRKYAIAEAKEREAEAEMYPMLHKDDIPFGARALESGIEIEGIWNSNPNTPIPSPRQPATPVGSRPASLRPMSLPQDIESRSASSDSHSQMISPKPVLPAGQRGSLPDFDPASAGYIYETPRLDGLQIPMRLPERHKILPRSILVSPAKEESLVSVKDPIPRERRISFHSRALPPPQHPDATDYRTGLNESHEQSDHVAELAGNDSHSSPEFKRASRFASKLFAVWLTECEANEDCDHIERLRRRSSEEFRRKMSQIFNDNISAGVSREQLEFNPALREYHRRDLRRSVLRPFRPRRSTLVNETPEGVEQPPS
ncbi:unnamed protein product [Penicillium olsonii]|nr:unnamed protein product [Penicillium olsonii]